MEDTTQEFVRSEEIHNMAWVAGIQVLDPEKLEFGLLGVLGMTGKDIKEEMETVAAEE